MNDTLYYIILGGVLLGVILAAVRDVTGPSCNADCDQGRKPCKCK